MLALAYDPVTVLLLVVLVEALLVVPVGLLLAVLPVPLGRVHGRPRERIPARVRAYVLWRDGYMCQRCGCEEDLQLDHVVPWSRGGTNDEWNLQVLCGSCNRDKGAKAA